MPYVIRDLNGNYLGKAGWSAFIEDAKMYELATYAARAMASPEFNESDIIEVASEQVWKEVGKV